MFGPLSMSDTGFAVSTENRSRLARLYTPDPTSGLAIPADELGDRILSRRACFSGGAGLVSTLADYDLFSRLLLGGGAVDGVRLLGSRTVDYLSRNHLPGDVDIQQFGGAYVADSRYAGVGHGLGIAVMKDPVAYRTLGSGAELSWNGAASTAFWVDPTEEITAILLTQLLPSGSYPLRTRFRQLIYSALID
ncbi:MAG: serine hydrolase [Frankiaceae bacterium]